MKKTGSTERIESSASSERRSGVRLAADPDRATPAAEPTPIAALAGHFPHLDLHEPKPLGAGARVNDYALTYKPPEKLPRPGPFTGMSIGALRIGPICRVLAQGSFIYTCTCAACGFGPFEVRGSSLQHAIERQKRGASISCGCLR